MATQSKTQTKTQRRVTVKRTYPNKLLFEYLLSHWKDEAKANDSQMRFTYATAHRSVKGYPIELQNGDEAKALLIGVGPTIAKRLNHELSKAMCANDGQPLDVDFVKAYIQSLKSGGTGVVRKGNKPLQESGVNAGAGSSTSSATAKVCTSAPSTSVGAAARSSSSAGEEEHGFRSKHDSFFGRLLDDDDCSSSSSTAQPSQHQQQAHCSSSSSPPFAAPLKRRASAAFASPLDPSPAVRVPPVKRNLSARAQSNPVQLGEITLRPGSFDIVLVVDNQETTRYRDVVDGLKQENCQFETRQLSIGDYVWVARDKCDDRKELVLDWVVERKRLDDLAHSIKGKGNRYREQKMRLLASGITNRVFLVENYKSDHLGLPRETLDQAIVNTQVHHNFFIWHTANGRDSARYLAMLTAKLRRRHDDKTLVSCDRSQLEQARESCPSDEVPLMTYVSMKEDMVKTRPMTAKEILARQLMVCPQMTGAKAFSVASKYGTWPALLDAYRSCAGRAEMDALLAKIPIVMETGDEDDAQAQDTAGSGKTVGMAASKKLARFFAAVFSQSNVPIG